MNKILEAFKWFCAVVAIATVTAMTVFNLVDHLADDDFSWWTGRVLILNMMITGGYIMYKCLDKGANVFRKDAAEKLKGDEYDF